MKRRTEPRAPTYDDLKDIVELLRATSRFSEFRLRSGDIEVEVKRANGSAPDIPVLKEEVKRETKKAEPARAAPAEIPPGTLVRAPMVGTVYRAPAPGAAPFVEVGAKVKADTTVCIIEVMKLMNTIPAGCAGVVTHVLAQNAQAVEAGQPLFAIRPE